MACLGEGRALAFFSVLGHKSLMDERKCSTSQLTARHSYRDLEVIE